MGSNAIWSIISVLASVVIGFLFYKLQQKYPLKLKMSFSIVARSIILKQIPSSFPELFIKYNDTIITNNLYYFEALIFNPRPSDVRVEKESPISLELPRKSEWCAIQIKNQSPLVGASVTINPEKKNQADLSFNLLRDKEFILLGCIVQADRNLTNEKNCLLSMKHRIPNLDDINYIECFSETEFKLMKARLWRELFWFVSITAILVVIPFVFLRSFTISMVFNTAVSALWGVNIISLVKIIRMFKNYHVLQDSSFFFGSENYE